MLLDTNEQIHNTILILMLIFSLTKVFNYPYLGSMDFSVINQFVVRRTLIPLINSQYPPSMPIHTSLQCTFHLDTSNVVIVRSHFQKIRTQKYRTIWLVITNENY